MITTQAAPLAHTAVTIPPVTITPEDVRRTIEGWKMRLIVVPATSRVIVLANIFTVPDGGVVIGDDQDLWECYRYAEATDTHRAGTIEAYAERLTLAVRAEIDGGRL